MIRVAQDFVRMFLSLSFPAAHPTNTLSLAVRIKKFKKIKNKKNKK